MKDKKTKAEKYQEAEEQETNQNVSEPAMVYGQYASTTMKTIGIMGMNGKKDFQAIRNDNDFISLIRTGVPRQVMDHLMEIADLTLIEMATITHTSDRTLRRYTPSQKLSQEQSERMIELARLYGRGEEILGTMSEFRQWMDTQLLAFGNKKPREFLDTSLGIGMIMDELGRIQHGIFA